MAVLGFQLVTTLISAGILQKLSARYSIGRQFLSSGLYRYLHPSTEQLKAAAGISQHSQKGAAHRRRNKADNSSHASVDSEGFLVPKQLSVSLEKVQVNSIDFIPLPLYVKCRWLVDYFVCAVAVFAISELYLWLMSGVSGSNSEVNLSVVWLLVGLIFALEALTSLTGFYFRTSENGDTGERSLVLSVGLIYFLLTMITIIFSNRYLDVDLNTSYENFTASANEFLKSHEVDINRSGKSPVLLYLFFSVLFGFVAALLVFPSFRYAQMYTDALRSPEISAFTRLLIHLSFLSPAIALVPWIKPVSDHLLKEKIRQFSLSERQLKSLKVWLIVGFGLLRLLTAKTCLQAYLNLANEKFVNLRLQSGRINSLELQRMVARVFIYFCSAVIQYFTPVLIIVTLTLLLKSCDGEYRWLSFEPVSFYLDLLPRLANGSRVGRLLTAASPTLFERLGFRVDSVSAARSLFFNETVAGGLCAFTLFVTTAICSSLSLVGVVYLQRFGNPN